MSFTYVRGIPLGDSYNCVLAKNCRGVGSGLRRKGCTILFVDGGQLDQQAEDVRQSGKRVLPFSSKVTILEAV